jgi:hypothetical protein
MAQKQGNSNTDAGRLDGSIGTAVASGDFALGVGWGTTATLAVSTGSNDQRGEVTVTSSGTGQAQATATVVLTFKDGAYAGKPFALVNLQDNTQAITDNQPTDVLAATTTLTWKHSVLPVDTKTYTFGYVVVA